MGNIICSINSRLERKCLRKYRHKKKYYDISMILILILYIVIEVVFFIVLKQKSNFKYNYTSFLKCFVLFSAGICPFISIIVCIPIHFGSKPFILKEKAEVKLGNKSFEYIYKEKKYYSEYDSYLRSDDILYNTRKVYEIEYNRIKSIEYDEKCHILSIIGKPQYKEINNFGEKKLVAHDLNGKKIVVDGDIKYSIILALGNNCEKAFVASLKQRAGLML